MGIAVDIATSTGTGGSRINLELELRLFAWVRTSQKVYAHSRRTVWEMYRLLTAHSAATRLC